MGNPRHDWLDSREILNLFGKQLKSSRKKYQQFVQDGMQEMKGMDLSGGGLVRSSGGWEKLRFLR